MKLAILAQTSNDRYFLGPLEAGASLLEWAKQFKGKLYKVQTAATPWTLLEIVHYLSKPDKLPVRPPHIQSRETIYEPPAKVTKSNKTVIQKVNYQEFLDQATRVREYLKALLMKGNPISLGQITEWAIAHKITLSKGGLSRHLQKVLDDATGQGYQVIKEGRTYQVTPKRKAQD